MTTFLVETNKYCKVDLTSNCIRQACSQETEGHDIPQHQAILIFCCGYGKCNVKGVKTKWEEREAAGISWSCGEDRVRTEWLILTVEKVCDRSKAHQQLENKQNQNVRNDPFPGYRAKFRFFQELIPFTSMRGENSRSHWNKWFPLLNCWFIHSNIWPMSPWPHQKHSCTASVIAGLLLLDWQDFQVWDRNFLLYDPTFFSALLVHTEGHPFPACIAHHEWNSQKCNKEQISPLES